MSRCTCRSDNAGALRAAKEFGFELDEFSLPSCQHCKEARRADEERLVAEREEHEARLHFFQMGTTERFGEIFEFMYSHGWRP